MKTNLFEKITRYFAPPTRILTMLFAICAIGTSTAWATDSLEETGGFVTSSSQLAFRNATLGDLTADTLNARFCGDWSGTGKGKVMTFNNFDRSSEASGSISCQAQLVDDGYCKSVFLTFTQADDDVNVIITAAKSKSGGSLGDAMSSGTSDANGHYQLCHLRLSRTPELYGGATVTWEAGEFATTKVGIDGNQYTITLPASGMSIDETTKNLVVAASGATTGATIDISGANTQKAGVLIKYSSLAAVSDGVSLATAQAVYTANGDLVVAGARTTGSNVLTMKGYWEISNNSGSNYAFDTVPSLNAGSGYFHFYYNDSTDNTINGTFGYAGRSALTLAGGRNSSLKWTNASYSIKKVSVGGPVTCAHSGVTAWPNVVVEKVALFVGDKYTASDIAEFEFTPTAEATIDAEGTYTLAGDNNLFDSIAADGEYVINVNEDATLNIPSATSVNMITFNVAANKTLTLTGNTLTAAGGIKVTGEGKVYTTAMSVLSGPIKGDGTLCYDMNNGTTTPTGLTCTKAAWTGVLWIKNGAYTGWQFSNFASDNSSLRLSNVECYINESGKTYNHVDLEGDGWKITNGNGYTVNTVKVLTGSGALYFGTGSSNGNGLVVQDADDFSGEVSFQYTNRHRLTFGNSGTYGTDSKIVVSSGATATIATGKTWAPNAFEVNGTLAFSGTGKASGPVTTANGSTLDLSGFTDTAPAISSALTLVSGTTIKLPAGATLPYQIASSGSGWVENVTLQIDGGATTTSAVKLANGAISLAKSATISGTMVQEDFSNISWTGSGDAYLLTLSADVTLLTFDDVSDVEELKIVVENNGLLYVAGELPENISVDGLTSLTVSDDETLTLAADYTRLYSQIGTTTTGNDALSSSGTTISVSYALLSAALPEGNYTIARWLTPQKLSSGYGHVATVSATVGTETDGETSLSMELVYMADRIVLRVYDATAQAARGTIKIWPYGDSITEGYNANHSGQNYRVLLYQKLALLGYNVQSVGCYNLDDGTESEDPSGQELPAAWKWHSAKHGATAGRSDTTASSRGNLEENVDTLCAQAGNPDVVLLHIGINDIVSSDRNPTTVYASIANVISKLESNLPNSIIVVSTVLDVATAAQTGRQINGVYLPTLVDQLNEKIRNGMSAFTSGRVVLADLNDYVKSADDGIIYDGVHPDWWGYDQMAEGWLAAITDNFTADDTFNDAMLPAVASSSLGAAAKAELADYRKGFKRYAVLEADKNILPTLETTIPYTDENSDAASANLSKVAYFVEYVRTDNNAHKWVWVDMDAFGTTIGDVGLPVANHQQVVRHLHVKSNHGAIDDVAADSEGVTGFIEFSPFGYGGASGSDSGPKDYSSRYDWNDTLLDSGTYACMQVHRIISTSAKPGGQVIFAFNNWRDSSTEAEFGIGNFSQHFSRGNQTFDYTDTKAISTMNAAAYSVKRIEIWTKPTSEYQSNDLKGTASNSPAVATFSDGNSEVFTLTIPGEGLVRVDQIVLGLRTDSETEINRLTTRRLAVYSGDTLLAMSDLMNGTGEKDMTTFFANGAAKQTFTFSQDCVLTCGTGYTLKLLNASGANGAWPALLESLAGAEDYSPIVNTTIVTSWRLTQSIYASKVYAATVSADVDAFGSLSFSPSLPTDSADRANSDLLVNVTDDATLTIGDAMPTVGSIRFSIADGVTLTLADPANINAGEVVVYGPGTLAFDDSATFKTGTDLEFAGAVNVALKSGQVLTTTGDIVVGSGATLTLAPATIAGFSASLVSAASISGEIALTAPDESSDYSIVTTSTAVTLRRTTKSAFAYEAYPNGGSPSGWFSAWNNTYSDNFSETSLRVGPSATIPYVYHVSSSSHPYYDLTARSSVSFAVYADVSQMQSSKGIIACFGNSSNGLLMYRNGDWIVAARISGGSVDRSWVPGVAVANGYHLYTVTYNSSNGKVAVYRDGNVSSASDGSAEYPHFASGALNAGFQFGTTYGGSNPTGFNTGEGLAVAAMRGYDVVLQQEEVAVIAESLPATDGNVTWNVTPDNSDNTVIVTSTTFGDSNYIGQSKGTLTIPAGSEVNVKHIRVLNNNATGDRATVNIAGTLNITSMSSDPNVWYESGSNKGILWGHWHGQATYNITGSLIGENAYLETVYTAEAQTINIDGGRVSVKGIYAGNANSAINLTNNGTLEVAEIPGTGTNSSGGQQATAAIALNLGYGTYRQKATGTVTHTMTLSGTEAQPTTLDPYGTTMTVNSMSGSGYVTVADSSTGRNGTVAFKASTTTFNGYVILTDANAANIDLTGYTGKVAVRGGAVATLGKLVGFTGTAVFDTAETYDARDVNLSGVNIQINNASAKLMATAGQEGSVTVIAGALDLYLTNDQFLTLGYVFNGGINPMGATLTYYHGEARTEGTVQWASGAALTTAELEVVQAGNNIAPYYRIFCGASDGTTGTLSEITHWENSPDALPTSGNMAIRVTGNKTLTVNIDNTTTFGEVQVFGSGTVIFTGSGTMTVTHGIYATSGTGFSIEGGIAEGVNVYALDLGTVAQVACGTEADPFGVAHAGGSGYTMVAAGAFVDFGTAHVDYLTVNGTANVGSGSGFRVTGTLSIASAGALNFTSTTFDCSYATLSIAAGGVVNATGATLTLNRIDVNGTLNMDSSSSLVGVTDARGTGTINWTGKQPDLTVWKDCSTWCGTNVVSSLSTDAQRQIQNWGRYASESSQSFIKLIDVRGWVDANTVINPEVILENGTEGYGLEISNGSTTDNPTYFGKISGSGTLKQTGSGGNQRYVVRDVSDFTGSIEKTDTVRVLILDATTIQANLPNKSNQGHMFVANITAKIGDGNGWSVASGKNLDIAGTATVEMLGSASMSGPVTFNNGETLKFDNIGTSVAPKKLTLSSSLTFESGTVNIAFGEAATLYDGATLIDWTANGAAPDGAFAFADSGLSDDWILVKEATGLKLYSGVIKDANEDRAGRVSIESDGSHKATISPTGAAVTLPARITKLEVSVTANGFGTLTAPGVVANTVVVKYGNLDTTAAYTITKNGSNVLAFALDPEGVVDGVSVTPALDNSSPIAVAPGATTPTFKVKTIPGVWYAVKYSDTVSGLSETPAMSEPVQATGSSTNVDGAELPGSGAKYYKIAAGATSAME